MAKTNLTPKQELEIVKDYTENNMGIVPICEKYHIGKLKVKKILEKYEIPLNNKGKQPLKINFKINDFKIKKYINTDKIIHIVYDENTNFESKDIDNSGGILTTYINKKYNIEIPTLYDRRIYYMTTGNYWWEQWLKVKVVEKMPTKKCPYCDWETTDLDNKSGMFETHLNKIHNISKLDYLKQYPEEKKYFTTVSNMVNRQMETDENKYAVCKICNKKLARIDNHHLSIHNMTKNDYVKMFGYNELTSKEYHEKQSRISIENNKNITFHKHSADEYEIINFLQKHNITVNSNRKILNGKEIDIFIPEKNIGIEYNGVLWHSEKFGKYKNYHLDKTIECERQGVRLIQIFEDEYNLHKEIVLSKICHILGINNKPKIYANKITIKEISLMESSSFLNINHIQGEIAASVYLGAFYNDILVGVMLFKKENDINWELTRFATDINYCCVGVAGKLFKHFIKNFNFNKIKSFADRRWTSLVCPSVYDKLGFTIEDIIAPDYKYYNNKVDRYKRFHKFGFRKKILLKNFPNMGLTDSMTESEMTSLLGYDRIWDCGLIKYVYINPNYKNC